MELYETNGATNIEVIEVPEAHTEKYGIIEIGNHWRYFQRT